MYLVDRVGTQYSVSNTMHRSLVGSGGRMRFGWESVKYIRFTCVCVVRLKGYQHT